MNLQFGTTTNIGIDPVVGYKIDRNNKWSVGVGGSYNYTRWNAYGANSGFSTYGYRTFTRYRLLPQLFAHAEFNHMNMVGYIDRATARLGRTWVPFLLVGGGYSASLGGRTYMTFTVLWDVLRDREVLTCGEHPSLVAVSPWASEVMTTDQQMVRTPRPGRWRRRLLRIVVFSALLMGVLLTWFYFTVRVPEPVTSADVLQLPERSMDAEGRWRSGHNWLGRNDHGLYEVYVEGDDLQRGSLTVCSPKNWW